jgi:hypothetical protein
MKTDATDFEKLLEMLKKAVQEKDKKVIIDLYEQAKAMDLEAIPDSVYSEYDELVSKGNDILYN